MDMAEQHDGSDWQSAARGESAWKEARDQVASRNQEARKAGKLRRETYQRERDAVRQAAEARRHAELLNRRRTP
jgi:hypothetical protein